MSVPMAVPQGADQRWSLDFVVDALADARRFRVLCVVDDFTREALATVPAHRSPSPPWSIGWQSTGCRLFTSCREREGHATHCSRPCRCSAGMGSPRVWTESRPVGDGGDEAYCGEEVAGGLVVAGGDGAEVLDATEGPLDDVAQPVSLGVVRDGDLARRGAGDDRDGAALSEEAAQMVGVVAFVADQFAWRCDSRDQDGSSGNVGDVAAGQEDRMRAALILAERVDLGGAPAARAADRLMAGVAVTPFFAPAAERCAFTAELSIIVTRGGSAQETSAAKMRCQSPRWLQRFQRLKTVVYGPYSGGKTRHRQPSRSRWMMPLITRRSFTRRGPV
jgi:hypothetical protein